MRKYKRNMRMESTLSALVSPTRQAILAATFLRPEKSWYLSELATHLGTRSSSLQREVDSLVRVGILEKRVDGRRSYIKANEESPIFPEIRGLIEKTSGIVPLLQEAVGKLGKKIRWGFIYGSLARGEEGARSDVDLMLIGDVSTMEMAPVLRRLEKTVDRQVNPTIFTGDDFVKNLARKNHFLLTVMREKKIMVKGTEDELEAIARSA
jgi:DNA-binding transcriptional ArsR family regulator